MVRLCVHKLAEERQMKIEDIVNATGLSRSVVRRYWYNSAKGYTKDDEPLDAVSMRVLAKLAAVLNVSVGVLFEEYE